MNSQSQSHIQTHINTHKHRRIQTRTHKYKQIYTIQRITSNYAKDQIKAKFQFKSKRQQKARFVFLTTTLKVYGCKTTALRNCNGGAVYFWIWQRCNKRGEGISRIQLSTGE